METAAHGDSETVPVTVEGRAVALRPVLEQDYPTLYSWRVDADFVSLWVTGGRRIPTYNQYLPELKQFLAEGITLLAVDNRSGHPGGFLRAYNLNPVDGWTWTQMYMTPLVRKRPFWIGEAAALFAHYLFEMFPLRKLYFEVFEYNIQSLRLCERLGCRPCGRFPDHIWYGDKMWDSVLFTLTRKDWDDLRDRFAFLLSIEHEAEDLLARRYDHAERVISSS